MQLGTTIAVIVAAVIVTALIAWNIAISYRKKVVEAKIGTAEEKAREILLADPLMFGVVMFVSIVVVLEVVAHC